MFKRHSPLDDPIAAGGRAGSAGGRALRLGLLHDWQLVQIGAFGRATAPLDAALGSVLGTPLPTSTSLVQRAGAHRLYRIAADQYWIVTPDAALWAKISEVVPATAGSVTRLSDARVRISVEGPAATALLGKLVSVDLRPRAFPVGSFAQTGLHHVGVLLERLGPEHFEIFALRTYAASSWDWLTDAALPYGYEVFSA